jgi:PPK2 family polyphosphate:nucleotide phosphotransferase
MSKINLATIARQYRVDHGRKFRLADHNPHDTGGLELEDQAGALLRDSVKRLASLQDRLYAQDRWAVLLVFQALDAAGKDGTIKHVMSGLNPQSCEVHAFKAPSEEEIDHDYLWRVNRLLPRRGHIGIFNRSYYEEVLVVRVHPDILDRQRLPPEVVGRHIWDERFTDINNFEAYLTRQGIVIRKFFLHVSREEQKRRFLKRLDEPEKNWKFSVADVNERKRFGDYMKVYDQAIRATSTPSAPWYVVPSDHKWFTRLVVASAVIETLESLRPSFPVVDAAKRRELQKVRAALLAESRRKR